MRTATTATDRSSTGGICQARVISHADTPARASALPSDSTPSAIAARTRSRRGRSNSAIGPAIRRRPATESGPRISRSTPGNDFDDPVADGEDRLAVADNDHRRTGAGPLDNGPQHALLGAAV